MPAVVDAFVSVILAPACTICDTLLDKPVAGPVCERCWGGVVPFTPPLCSRCGEPVPAGPAAASVCPRCRGSRSPVACSRAVGEYAGTLRALVHLLKYDKRRSLAPRLARLMRSAGGDVLRGADAAIPVPLHWTRKWRRGFNQASLLARGLGVAVWPAIARIRATSPQVDLTAAARHLNMRDAFAIARRPSPWHAAWRARLKDKIVVLVDDVSTTGATLEACAKALRAGGAREVRALTAARVAGSQR